MYLDSVIDAKPQGQIIQYLVNDDGSDLRPYYENCYFSLYTTNAMMVPQWEDKLRYFSLSEAELLLIYFTIDAILICEIINRPLLHQFIISLLISISIGKIFSLYFYSFYYKIIL